ncbi:MAG: SRPBCC family protein [Nitrospirales bacterium]|nr:SRPBCC family protein [Nitrospira sp.]MDR4501443.1 SRPBCC family protein [Nitrospirales bacterium]
MILNNGPVFSLIKHVRTTFACLCIIFLGLFLVSSAPAFAGEEPYTLQIEVLDHGAARIHGRLTLLTDPQHAFKILTDYEHWNALFPQGFQIQLFECLEDCTVIADMTIPHALVPWSTHLRVKAVEHPPQTFELQLLEGDYEQYHLRWEFTQGKGKNITLATMTLLLQPQGWLAAWTPNVLYEWTLRNGLEDHFERILTQVSVESARQ